MYGLYSHAKTSFAGRTFRDISFHRDEYKNHHHSFDVSLHVLSHVLLCAHARVRWIGFPSLDPAAAWPNGILVAQVATHTQGARP
ncbi:MAG: hypothetical protein BWZ07_02378 [Alphaproteobacteria bacterium ADurb.BinA280]|nr:MAG: hypothetical protein BWZ07_02378 [Alphaproteobacteria bacterium ADurb.BinA280]